MNFVSSSNAHCHYWSSDGPILRPCWQRICYVFIVTWCMTHLYGILCSLIIFIPVSTMKWHITGSITCYLSLCHHASWCSRGKKMIRQRQEGADISFTWERFLHTALKFITAIYGARELWSNKYLPRKLRRKVISFRQSRGGQHVSNVKGREACNGSNTMWHTPYRISSSSVGIFHSLPTFQICANCMICMAKEGILVFRWRRQRLAQALLSHLCHNRSWIAVVRARRSANMPTMKYKIRTSNLSPQR